MNNYLIKIEDIENSANKRLQVQFEDFIDNVKSNEPIKADLEIVSLGEFIKVAGHIKGCAILECDLCLNEFDYDFDIELDEMFAKNSLMEEYGQELELKEGQFVTDLFGSDEIDIYDLLYQSVILNFPNKKVCGINCKGDNFENEESFSQNVSDPRLAVFKDIKVKPKQKGNDKEI